MNVPLLINALVRQMTVLIAQLATSGGVRAPIAHLANQVFLELAAELQAQGISRKVSADMFGMALRGYMRKLRRLSEGQTEPGTTLWEAVLEFIRQQGLVTRERAVERFARDEERQVLAILHDLTESGMVFCSGSGADTAYCAASDEELGQLAQLSRAGLDELAWVLIYRCGPVDEAGVGELLERKREHAPEVLARLLQSGRVARRADGRFEAIDFVIPLDADAGWEAAVFDHFQAMVQTVCQRLQQTTVTASEQDVIGGSTYSFDIWPGHPLEHEVKTQLRELRTRCGGLRKRVEAHNRTVGLPDDYEQLVLYAGQCLLERGSAQEHGATGAEESA